MRNRGGSPPTLEPALRPIRPIQTTQPTRESLVDRLLRWAQPPSDDLDGFAVESGAGLVSQQRARERWLQRQVQESATFRGLLVDAAERATPLELQTSSGRSHRGVIVTVGGDFVAVATGPRAAVLVTQSSLVSLIAERRDLPIASGDRTTASHLTMRRVMFGMAADRPRVSLLATGAPEATTGTLRSTGVDVCSVQLDGVERRVAHVFLHSVVEVVLLDG